MKMKRQKTKSLKYVRGVAWIAQNDEPGNPGTRDEIAGYVSVMLLADVFDVAAATVARDVIEWRAKSIRR